MTGATDPDKELARQLKATFERQERALRDALDAERALKREQLERRLRERREGRLLTIIAAPRVGVVLHLFLVPGLGIALVRLLSLLFLAVVVTISVLCPLLLGRLSQYKEEICGPWDFILLLSDGVEASPRKRAGGRVVEFSDRTKQS